MQASFDIDAETGQLKTEAPLDYETQTDYEVTVIATDNGEVPLTPLSPVQSRSLSTLGMSQ